MKFRTTFRGKILLLTILPLAAAQIVTYFAVMRTVEDDIEQRARESLIIGGTVVSDFLENRGKQLQVSVNVLAADFGLKEAVATGDASTIQSALSNHRQRVGADIALLFDLDANAIASSNHAKLDNQTDFSRLVKMARDKSSVQSTASFDGDIYHTFTVPVRAPVTIAWVVLGFRIDRVLAERLRGLTGLEVSLVSTLNDGARIITTTGDAGAATKFASTLVGAGNPLDSIYMVDEAGRANLTLSTSFGRIDSRVLVVLQRSLHAAMVPYNEASAKLLVFSVALIVLVMTAAGLLSGYIVRPLRLLTVAAKRMSSGQYGMKVGVSTTDEIGELASSFNAMRMAIADREKRISHQALHDPVTDLPNGSKMLQSLTGVIEYAQSAKVQVTVLSIKLSRMSEISSTLGQSAHDQVIALAARHLSVNLGPGEILGHVGTNEFILVLPDSDIGNAVTYTDRIERILSTGVTLGRVNITLQTEIGISGFPDHGDKAADLMRYASIARNEAKLKKERVKIYEAGREDHYLRQLRIVNDLRSALQSNDIYLHFQPKISLPDGVVCGVEALVRWEHPELGSLSPDEFIPAAEQSGTIVYLTRFVLANAVKQCRQWQNAGHPLGVSVNLSARDLQDEYLPHYILQLLNEHDITPDRLTLEITEHSVMEDIHHAISVLECLRHIGVRISMDDFGTGHSSLAQIKNMPLHELKIDKSFITTLMSNEQNKAIVRTMIELAHNMNLIVVAEGIEDEDTLRQLSDLGCEQAQGYFMSKPISSDDLLLWLKSRKAICYTDRRKKKRTFAKKA
ncbi:MAG: EAL domain-containing protein [Proteobacteria bacterium]|nr:EAL domain-containing protein [Pseudomonadota bacterium]